MIKSLFAAFILLSAPLVANGEVRIGGLITPKSIADNDGPLNQAIVLSVGNKTNRFEILSDVWALRRTDKVEGSWHKENALTIAAGYRHTFLVDKVNPTITLRGGYERQVMEDHQTLFGFPAGVRIVQEGAIGIAGLGIEYWPSRRLLIGAEAGFWGILRGTQGANWEIGSQFPILTASYSFF